MTAVIAACSSDLGSDGLSPSSLARAAGDSTGQPPRDTAKKPPRDTTQKPPRDTLDSMPPLPEKVQLSGRVLAVTVIAPGPGVRDTLRFEAIAGAKVRVMRNLLVDGQATQRLAAERVTDANGAFTVRDLAGGYYVVYADPPAGSPYQSSFSYLAATKPEVKVDVYLWRRP
ncbi:MAG: hypothetical protein AB1762_03270 [Gemmatimonadota bacterium]